MTDYDFERRYYKAMDELLQCRKERKDLEQGIHNTQKMLAKVWLENARLAKELKELRKGSNEMASWHCDECGTEWARVDEEGKISCRNGHTVTVRPGVEVHFEDRTIS